MTTTDRVTRFSRIGTNGIHLHVAEAGPADGPLLILLHGFPEFWYGWRGQMGTLAAMGFHVVAPDQRGYNLSDKPEGVASYDLDQLAADVIGLADFFRKETFTVVGHDWGAAVSWWLAAHHRQRIGRMVILNAPFPAVWMEAMRNHPEQKRRSRYVRLFEMRFVPEILIGINRRSMLRKTFRDCTRPEAFTSQDLDLYQAALSQPGALTATVNYYRAALRKPLDPAASYRIEPPTLVLWGDRDAYAVPELADASVRLCSNARLVHVPECTHWIQHEQPQRVAERIAEFANGS